MIAHQAQLSTVLPNTLLNLIFYICTTRGRTLPCVRVEGFQAKQEVEKA